MSQISGVKKPLSHTNSLTKLPKYGVETVLEEDLGKLLQDVDKWGLDMFKLCEYSVNHPLTAVTYRIFRVSLLHSGVHLINEKCCLLNRRETF